MDRHVINVEQTFVFTDGVFRVSDDLDAKGVPVGSVNEAAHAFHGFCWCQPGMEQDRVTGNRLFLHRSNLDELHVQAMS